MLLGSNDIGRRGGRAVNVSSDPLRGLVAAMVRHVFKVPSVQHLVVASVLPRRDIPAEQLASANRAIELGVVGSLQHAEGRVSYAHCAGRFNSTVHTYDGVHPTEPAERLLADCFFERIAPLLGV
eukprot:TRINITY_DN33663_c0_g1_i1.p1 TRINITY_DN33663_c0_g1~~TRINITY_DN33663_c0_g1_i1.p1  ORF type:complete len:125 (+),score=15.53 TRINITY_DN33663_c0_g1_i1:3-377(+)